MNEPRMTPEQDSVAAEVEIAAPPERVFQALTAQQQLFTWWGSEPSNDLTVFDMDPRPGNRYRYSCEPKPGIDHGAVVEQLHATGGQSFDCHGEILEMDHPPRLLVWSWLANWHEHPNHPTSVRWELTPTKNGKHIRVTHSGLAQEPVCRKDYGSGWQGVLQLLNNYLRA